LQFFLIGGFLMKNARITLVLMAGLPGAGKTTLAYALGRELEWDIIDKDKYRRDKLRQGLEDDAASRTAYEESFKQVRCALREKQVSVIFDTAALHHFVLDTVREIMHGVEYACLKVILCVADRDLRNDRLRRRRDESTRIRVNPATIADYLRCFEHLPSDKLIIYTSDPFDEYLNQAKRYIENTAWQ
jgi:predicted kinase